MSRGLLPYSLEPERTAELRARLLKLVEIDASSGCWLWKGPLTFGYARRWIDGKRVYVHRAMYELTHGAVSDELDLDHVCRVRRCINPAHMEKVTPTENNRRGDSPSGQNGRKSECRNGHPFTEENTYRRGDRVARECRACRTEAVRKYYNSRRKSPRTRTH